MMRISIERIDISAFGKLSAVSIQPSEGINIIDAANESGKSTLAAFVKFVLYGIKSRQGSIIDNPKKMYMPWSGAAAAGSLTMRVGNHRIRVERVASGNTEKLTCTDLLTGKSLYDGLVVGEEIFGVGAELFEKTAFFSSLNRPEVKDEDLAKSLQGLLFSSDTEEEAEQARKLLTKQKNALQGRAGAGEIPMLEKRLVQLADKLENEKSNAEEQRALSKELESISKTAAAREADMQRLDAERKNAEDYEAVGRLAEYETLVSEHASAAEKAEKAETKATLEDIKACRELKKECEFHEKTITNENAAKAECAAKRKKKSMLFLALAGVFAVTSGVLFVLTDALYGVATAVLAAVMLAVWLFGLKRKPDSEVSDAQRTLQTAEKELEKALIAYGKEGVEFERAMDELTDAVMEAEKLKATLSEKAKAVSAFEERNDIDALRETAKNAVKPTRAKKEIEFEYQFALQSAAGLRRRESDKKSRLAVLEAERADIAVTESELDATRDLLAKAQKRFMALTLALSELEEAENDLRATVVPRLASLTEQYFARLTDGKYTALELDNKISFGFESEYGMKSAEHLSAGTREGLYLCLRLALLKLIYGEDATPLLLDDAFARMDSERLSAFVRLLGEEGRQCFIFACNGREKKALDENGISYKELKL